jgi:ABC-type multidrug transport system ATPase subunit
MPNIAIQTQALTKNYGPVRALRGVDLEVRQGEIFGFLGPNGAGKTTTIRCLLEMIRPNSGTGGWKMPAWMTMGWWLSLGKKQE